MTDKVPVSIFSEKEMRGKSRRKYEEMKIVVVTGGTKGIGAQVALDFLKQGDAFVVITSRNVPNLSDAFKAYEGKFEHVKMDVADQESVNTGIAQILEKHGRIDVLVNNAGITRDTTMKKMQREQWDAVIGTNLTGAFHTCKAVMPGMIEQKSGRIINISSVIGLMGNFGQANYSASKAGLIGFTKSLALELIRYGITVNAVAPGFIATEMTAAIPEEAMAKINAKIPFGAMGTPEDISNAVLFLAKDESRYITGETLSVNGGLYMH